MGNERARWALGTSVVLSFFSLACGSTGDADGVGNTDDGSTSVDGGAGGCGEEGCEAESRALELRFITPESDAVIAGDLEQVLIEAKDADGVAEVELFLEDVSLGKRTDEPFAWTSADTPALAGLADGSYTLEAVARDTAGESASATTSFVVKSEARSVIEIEVTDVDDRLTLWVDDIPRRSWRTGGPGQSVRQDISAWFGQGTNSVRLQHENDSSGASFTFRLFIDGALELEQTAEPGNGVSVELDQSFEIEVPHAPALREITFDGPDGAALYFNDTYTGRSTPTTLLVPQGELLVGLGVGDFVGQNRYEAEFHESTLSIVVPQSFDLEEAPAPTPNVWRVALLPVRTTYHGSSALADTGVLLDSDITRMESQLNATSELAIEPLSYGLMEWEVTRLDVVDTPLTRPFDPGSWPETGILLEQANLEHLEDEYDLVVYLYSEHRADGTPVASRPCCGWGGGKGISIPTGWVRNEPADEPNEGYVHEALHSYESYQGWLLYRQPVTIGGLHGGGAQGYQSGDCGEQHYMCWYKRFIRGQVGIDLTMDGTERAEPALDAALYGGVFYTMRRGIEGNVGGPLASPP